MFNENIDGVQEKTHKTISFIGRPTAWKGMWLFRDLHYNYFMKDNWISIIEGMDITMSTMLQLYTTKKDKIPRNDVNLKYLRESKDYINKENYQLQYNNPIYIFPAYINEYDLEFEGDESEVKGINTNKYLLDAPTLNNAVVLSDTSLWFCYAFPWWLIMLNMCLLISHFCIFGEMFRPLSIF